MSKVLTTPGDVIDTLGGTQATAVLFGLPMQAVSNWRKSKTLPSSRYLVMSMELLKRGYSAPPSLWGLIEPRTETERPRARA